jgi:hypothetical protein
MNRDIIAEQNYVRHRKASHKSNILTGSPVGIFDEICFT